MDLAVDHGRVTADSRFVYRTDHVAVETILGSPRRGTSATTHFHVDGELAISARGPAGLPGAQLAVSLPRGALRFDRGTHEPLQLTGVDVAVASTSVDVMQAWGLAGGHARVEAATLADLAWLNELPLGATSSTFIGGRGRASASFVFSPEDVEGSVGAAVEDASGEAGETPMAWIRRCRGNRSNRGVP